MKTTKNILDEVNELYRLYMELGSDRSMSAAIQRQKIEVAQQALLWVLERQHTSPSVVIGKATETHEE